MSVWKYVFDSEFSQRNDIEDLKRRSAAMAGQQRSRSLESQTRLEELEQEVGELTLLCRALLTVLRENGTIRPEAIEEVMRKIDLEDGVEDGKVTRKKDPPAAPKPRFPRRKTL